MSLGHILKQISQGQGVQQAFMQAKPAAGQKQQMMIGAARAKPNANAPLVAAKVQEIAMITALLASMTKDIKGPNFLAGMPALVGDVRASEKQIAMIVQQMADKADAAEMAALIRALDAILAQLKRGIAEAVARVQHNFQQIDAVLDDAANAKLKMPRHG